MMQTKKEDQIVEEFTKRIKSYDTLNFLKDKNMLSSLIKDAVKMDMKTIEDLTSKQLQALPLRR